jgi:uncharacterized membrane protein
MSNSAFFDFRANAKQFIAEFFFLLTFLVLLRKEINQRSKWLILICFYFALVVSYYTLNYLFLLLILFTWLCGKIFMKNENKKVNSVMVIFFFVLTFLWYIYVSGGVFDRLAVIIINDLKAMFEDIFSVQSISPFVKSAIGAVNPPSFIHQIGRIIFDVTAFFILIGFIKFIVDRKKQKFDPEYFLLLSVNTAILLTCVIIPMFSLMLQMDRMYHVTLLFISPLFVIGGRAFFEGVFKILHVKKEKKRETCSLILTLAVLVTFFLFQTGFVYEVTKDPVPSSISLSKYRMDEYTKRTLGLVDENDFFGATWLSEYGNLKYARVYSDVKSKTQVLTDSLIDVNDSVSVLSNTTVFANPSYLYLGRYNTMTGILLYNVMYPNNIRYNISEIYIFNRAVVFNNKLYSNGACEIYYYAP